MSTWASLTNKTKQYTITTPLLSDQDYTISVGRVDTDSIDVLIGNELVGSITDSPLTFRVTVPSDSLTIRVYYDTTIDWIKLEKGNRATDWTPAIAEIVAEVNDPSNYSWVLNRGDLSVYQPSIYDGVLEYEEVLRAEGGALLIAHLALINMVDSQKLSTMPIDTIISYEGIFGIIGNPDTETIEFRRQRIINRLSLKPPFPMEFLESRLDEIIGVGRWTMEYDNDEFTLYIESSASDQQWATELSITINSIKPANIVYVNMPAIFSGMYVNSKSGYSQNTANYVSGLWIVGQKDIVSYADKGDIVMATTLTMTDTMMELMLVQLKDDIVADFYLNDSVVKPAVKTINSATNQLVSTCALLASDGITNLTKVVLRNASGQALDIHNVSVPVLDDITLKHTLTIGEGVK